MSQAAPTSMSWSRKDVAVAALLAAGCVAVFARACWNEFINYDDFAYIIENANVRAGLTAKGILWALTSNEQANWHPLTWLSLEMDSQLFGLRAWGFHLTNLLLHAANAVLLFAVLRAMTGALWRSALVAALFGVHPLHVESVAWAAERKDVLSTFFWMLTMGAYVRYVALPSKKRYLAMIAFFALGLTAKPMLVTLPFVLLLLDYWPLNRLNSSPLPSGERGRDEGSKSWPLHPSPQPSPQRGEGAIQRLLSPAGKRCRREGLALIVEKLPLFALTLISSIVTFWAQHTGGTVSTLEQLSFPIRLESALVGYVGYSGEDDLADASRPVLPVVCRPSPRVAGCGFGHLGRGIDGTCLGASVSVFIFSGRMALVPGDAGAGNRSRAGGPPVVGRPLHVRPAHRHLSGARLGRG